MTQEQILEKIKLYHHKQKNNCAQTTLKILSETFGIDVCRQVIDSACGLNGGGRYGAQCGLLEGALMFMGIKANKENRDKKYANKVCYAYTEKFKKEFESLLCKDLRPEGFKKGDPPDVCEKIFVKSLNLVIEYIKNETK
jgi:C_GCAxxG_C_C family probable redox protein